MDTGVVIDVETTGRDAEKDRIIEVGLIEFGIIENQQEPVFLQSISELQDPGIPIPSEITKLTGISAQMVVGRSPNWTQIREILERSSVVIAHNAEFDRGFLSRVAELKDLKFHWACSVKHIQWHKKGYGTRKLTYLAADHGFVNPFPHRALFDCATTYKVIAPYISELVSNSYEPEVVVRAVQAPFETKDILKERYYRWDNVERVWRKTILHCDLEDERNFLREKVYTQVIDQHLEEIITVI